MEVGLLLEPQPKPVLFVTQSLQPMAARKNATWHARPRHTQAIAKPAVEQTRPYLLHAAA